MIHYISIIIYCFPFLTSLWLLRLDEIGMLRVAWLQAIVHFCCSCASCKKVGRSIIISVFTNGKTDNKRMGDAHLSVFMSESKLGPRSEIRGKSWEAKKITNCLF